MRWRFLCLLVLLSFVAGDAGAANDGDGTVSLVWSPSGNADDAVYRVFYGTKPRRKANYPKKTGEIQDTKVMITGLEDCKTWYFAVKAFGESRESGFSTEVQGLPRPRVTELWPAMVEGGQTYTIRVKGVNFHEDVVLEIDAPGFRVLESTPVGCYEMEFRVRVDDGVALGAVPIYVVNPDRSYGEGVLDVVEEMPTPGNVPRARRGDTKGGGK